MQIDFLKNRTILMLGKSRALSSDEYQKQLETHSVTCKSRVDSDVVAVIEGRMLNPLESDRLEVIYLDKKLPIFKIDDVEKWLCSHINDKKLLMSLKLSRDTERLFGFLTNPLINDELFLKLFGMYNFQNESFFENDENRDVTAALIGRFYPSVEKDHNVVYSSMGMVQLIQKTDNAILIDTIANLSMIKEALKDEYVEGSHFTILQALCIHESLSVAMQKKFASSLHVELKLLLSMRENLDVEIESILLVSQEEVLEQLSINPYVSVHAIERLLDTYTKNVVSNHTLDEELFKTFLTLDVEALSSNIHLTCSMQKELLDGYKTEVVLAQNSSLCEECISTLKASESQEIEEALAQNSALDVGVLEGMMSKEYLHVALASNTSSSVTMIEKLSLSSDINILENLAQNSSTPLDILNLFMLDYRLEHMVRDNQVIQENFRR